MKKPGITVTCQQTLTETTPLPSKSRQLKNSAKYFFLNYSPARSTYQQHHDKGSRTLEGTGNDKLSPTQNQFEQRRGTEQQHGGKPPIKSQVSRQCSRWAWRQQKKHSGSAKETSRAAEGPRAKERNKELGFIQSNFYTMECGIESTT